MQEPEESAAVPAERTALAQVARNANWYLAGHKHTKMMLLPSLVSLGICNYFF